MFEDGSLSFREFATREPLPLATVHDEVLEFLRDRADAVLVGAQAVNAYVDESRMTQDVDLISPRAAELAEELRADLVARFRIAIVVRTVAGGLRHRLEQERQPSNRHLADVRSVAELPRYERVQAVQVIHPVDLIGQKVVSMVGRSGTAKAGTDLADICRLLLTFPGLKSRDGDVAERLRAWEASEPALEAWREIAAREIRAEDDEEGY